MKGERKTYKAINFDFDTKKLALARGSAPKCYYEIRKTMKRLGFDHRQGSGYVSREKVDSTYIAEIVRRLYEAHDWLPDCIKEFDITNVTRRQYSMKAEFAQAKAQVDARMAEDPLYAMQIKRQRERVRSAGDAAAHDGESAAAPSLRTLTAISDKAREGKNKGNLVL